MAESLRVDDFSGGRTDHYLNGPLNCAREYDNFLIGRNKKPIVRPGSALHDGALSSDRIPAGQQRISKLTYFDLELFEQSARNVYKIPASHDTISGPTGNPVFGAGTTTSHVAFAEMNKHIVATIDAFSTPRKIYKDNLNVWHVNNVGLPDLASSPSIALTAGASSVSYVYAFLYRHAYMVGTITHTVRGPTTLVAKSSGAASAIGPGTPASITSIPVLANGSTENYATSDIVVEIYRTVNGGTEFRLVGTVTNGTTSYSDVTPDASLGVLIYTTGGVKDYDPPPPSKYVVVVNSIAWWGNVLEGTEEHTNRIRQSVPGIMDAAPTDLFTDVDGEIVGMNAIDIYPIVFERTKCWRLEGVVDSLGRGVTSRKLVSSTIGTVSNNGIVPVTIGGVKGLCFPGPDGFYFTDGFRTQKLSDHLDTSYAACVSTTTREKRIYGVLEPVSQRIYWTMQEDSSASDCDRLWILDPYWGLSSRSSFTTWSGDESFVPTALVFVDKELVRADARGHVFRHRDSLFTDQVVDVAVPSTSWVTSAVIYDLTSCAHAFGDDVNSKYVTKLTIVAKNETSLSLQPQSINDDSGDTRDLKEIRFRNNLVWGDSDVDWGDPSISWNYQGTIIEERRFPARGLRCVYKQVRFTNALTIFARSDDYGLATFDPSGPSALLLSAPAKEWPEDLVGFLIYTAADDYDEGFEIAARSDDTLTLIDTGASLPTGDYAWVIRGYRKGERLNLEAYTLQYEMFGESTPGFDPEASGRNA